MPTKSKDRKFTKFLVITIAMLTISFFLRDVFEYANGGFEALTIIVTGILAVWGVYEHGVREGKKIGKEN